MKIALVGAGAIGRIHAANVAAHPEAELSIVCDTNKQAAEQLASYSGCRRTF